MFTVVKKFTIVVHGCVQRTNDRKGLREERIELFALAVMICGTATENGRAKHSCEMYNGNPANGTCSHS
jgi:hypothetical protein